MNTKEVRQRAEHNGKSFGLYTRTLADIQKKPVSISNATLHHPPLPKTGDNMNIGDLVRVTGENNAYYGEIGIVTELPNDGFFAIVHIPSMSEGYWFSPETLEVIA